MTIKRRNAYTTGQAAKICNVATQTMIRCCEATRLEYFRIPGSLHRRIPHDSLVTFMREHNIPLPKEFSMIVLGSKVRIFQHDDVDLVGQVGTVTAITNVTATVQINLNSQVTRVVALENLKLIENDEPNPAN